MTNQSPLFPLTDLVYFPQEQFFHKRIIEDRGSKYSVLGTPVERCRDPQRWAKLFSHGLKKESFFRKATHNSYAWRYEDDEGRIVEGYHDDGEKGAGLCILRELRQARLVNGLVVVTREYGGVKLEGDRFRHVIDATKYVVQKMGR